MLFFQQGVVGEPIFPITQNEVVLDDQQPSTSSGSFNLELVRQEQSMTVTSSSPLPKSQDIEETKEEIPWE